MFSFLVFHATVGVSGRSSEANSNVGAKVALWSQRLQDKQEAPRGFGSPELQRRKATRFRTQPITFEEVRRASALNNDSTTPGNPQNNYNQGLLNKKYSRAYLIFCDYSKSF